MKVQIYCLLLSLPNYHNSGEGHIPKFASHRRNNSSFLTDEDLKLPKQDAESLSEMVSWYRTFIDWKSRSQVDFESARKTIDAIRDYSLLLETKCGYGTGWFLDYELPEKVGEYPTKWFIATNAHVIYDLKFKSNPYGQKMPVTEKTKRGKNSCIANEITLNKETVSKTGAEGIERDPSYWKVLRNRSNKRKGKDSLGANRGLKMRDNSRYPKFSSFTEKEPKLFYVPINYLGEKPYGYSDPLKTNDPYYVDFAVIEVDFKDQEKARIMTRGLYSEGDNRNWGINLFNWEKVGDYVLGKDELRRRNILVAGYPRNAPNEYISYGNVGLKPTATINKIKGEVKQYSKPQKEEFYASNLQHDSYQVISVKNKNNGSVFGLTDFGKQESMTQLNLRLPWGDEKLWNWGYGYVIDNSWMGAGASGSLVSDEYGNVLGLYRAWSYKRLQGYVVPLRSTMLQINGKVVSPSYDVIEGTGGQISSYRSQVEKYILSRNGKTGLSKLRNWTLGEEKLYCGRMKCYGRFTNWSLPTIRERVGG